MSTAIPTVSPVLALTAAIALIDKPEKWTRGYYRSKDGRRDFLGALAHVFVTFKLPDRAYQDMVLTIEVALNTKDLATWNDEIESHDELMRQLLKALKFLHGE